MTAGSIAATGTQGQELLITRVFEAPRERVWKAWTDPERLKQWWGPKGSATRFTSSISGQAAIGGSPCTAPT